MKPVLVASHMRSGTHLTIDLLRRNLSEVSADYLDLDRLAPHHGEPLGAADFEARLARLGERPILKSHWPLAAGWFDRATPEGRLAEALLEGADRFYVARDGRDVMVSLYFYARHFSERAREQDFSAFLRDRDDFFQVCPDYAQQGRVGAWARHVERWLGDADTHVLHYDALAESPTPSLQRMASRLGLEAPTRVEPVAVPSRLPTRVLRKLLAPIRPRRFSTAIRARGGGSGGFRRHFTSEDETFFLEQASAALGSVAGRVRAAASDQASPVEAASR